MAATKRLKFLRPVGLGTMRFASGAVADVPEVWADRYIANGSAEEVAAKVKVDKSAEPTTKSKGKK